MLIETTHSTTQRARCGSVTVTCKDHGEIAIRDTFTSIVISQEDLPAVIEALQAMRRPA